MLIHQRAEVNPSIIESTTEGEAMENVCVSVTKQEFISTIKGNGKTYFILENCELWPSFLYDMAKSESGLVPDIVDSVVLPGGYGWTFKPDTTIFNQLVKALAAKKYKLIFSATGAECCGD